MTASPLPSWLAPLLSPEELGISDRFAVEQGVRGFDLMLRAGRALAVAAASQLPGGRIAVLCGPGNNGGDGLVAAQALHEAGRDVIVLITRGADGYRGDAALARDACSLPLRAFEPTLLDGATGAIDALLGTGATGAPRNPELEVIRTVAERGLPVIACDLPTGIDAATGEILGEAIQAIRTVTFHRPSPGHVVRPAKGRVGVLQVVDIGIPAGAPVTSQTGALTDAVLRALPTRGGDSHKYAAGAVVVLAGGAKYPGAGLLCVRGAQRAGAGYVTAVVSEPAVALVRGAAPEAIVQAFPDESVDDVLAPLLAHRADAIVVGPGLGDDDHAAALIDAALGTDRPVVLDADGLAPFAGTPERLRRSAPLIITPHAGELARLLGLSSAQLSAARLGSVREAARRSQAVVVLKGDDTLIAVPDGRVAINDLPVPALATAGTGDVLAGAIGALLAAGIDPWLAACAGVRLHARAGRLAAAQAGAPDGVVAFDVAEHLPAARGSFRPS